MEGPVVPVELQVAFDLVRQVEPPHPGVRAKPLKLGQLLLKVSRFRQVVLQQRGERHAVMILPVHLLMPLRQSRQVCDRLIDRPVSQEGLYARLIELEPVPLNTPVALFVQPVDDGLDLCNAAHLISMLKDLPTLPYAIAHQLSTLIPPRTCMIHPRPSSARRMRVALYWVFVGLFILSIAMFIFGVIVGNVSIGALGVIIVFLLYLFRRWFLPQTPDDTDK